jgi:hypothetical protein
MSGSSEMCAGTGSFEYQDVAAGDRGHINVFYHVPKRVDPDSNLMIAMHGLDRSAADFRDVFISASERLGRTVVVPEFDTGAFPDVFAYNFGNVVSAPPDSRLNDRNSWGFSLIDRLFGVLTSTSKSPSGKFDLYGNSAGSQFVLRYVALNPAPYLQTAISSNSGVYMVPDLSLDYPIGMGGVGLTESDLRGYLSRRIHILLGDADIDATAADLPQGAEAAAQGPNRLARGLWHYEHCKALARTLGIDLGWTLEIVPNAGHISQAIFDRALMISR